MSTTILKLLTIAVLLASGANLAAAQTLVPFRGTFAGQTVSAEPTENPAIVFVITAGGGQATQLGAYTMVVPHLSHLNTGFAEGEQIFTAANGDQLTAEFAGFLEPTAEGLLAGDLDAVITGGTGRFQGATGSYVFQLVFDFATFSSVAVIDGEISTPRPR
jgi:hypothetical protein